MNLKKVAGVPVPMSGNFLQFSVTCNILYFFFVLCKFDVFCSYITPVRSQGNRHVFPNHVLKRCFHKLQQSRVAMLECRDQGPLQVVSRLSREVSERVGLVVLP